LFGFSRQIYYRSAFSRKKKQERAKKVTDLVHDVRNKMPRIGSRKLYHILQPQLQDLALDRDKLFTILKANNMLIKPLRSYHITTDSHHRFRTHKNLIEHLSIKRPEQVWVAAITYVGHRTNPCICTHAYSKKIVGYNSLNSLAVEGSLGALKMAMKDRKYKQNPLIHH
jgi:putative transposase